VSIMNLCTAWNISVFRSYENDLFPCNNKSILMSILLFFGINVCMESNKINLKLLNLGQISKKWLLNIALVSELSPTHYINCRQWIVSEFSPTHYINCRQWIVSEFSPTHYINCRQWIVSEVVNYMCGQYQQSR
jgi:hypothetical protein